MYHLGVILLGKVIVFIMIWHLSAFDSISSLCVNRSLLVVGVVLNALG